MDSNMPNVSIIIVCMNNLQNLYPCLQSVKKYTTKVSYETFVVAYLFTKENLEKLRKDFPWVKIVESNEIRGFSENNNLALRQAQGKYCFVLNDDTEMFMPVVDLLVETIEKLPEDVAVVSPKSYYKDGRLQSCGRPKHTFGTFVLTLLKLWKEQKIKSPYINQEGIFQTYDIWGAFFLIKTSIFQQMGWFDETYFFSPEDIALSRKLNESGYKCYVNSDVSIIHYEGMTGQSKNMIKTATKPAGYIGNIIFYAKGNRVKYFVYSLITILLLIPLTIIHGIMGYGTVKPNWHYILAKANSNCIKVLLLPMRPKEAFIKFFHQIKK